ncbi:glycoside hydrolase family protein [Paraburkholderia sp. MM6662-R1]|uniref:glycoside hydrolase family protein n=1 Tax=Paraburkholderia sp. MM6662-R1 TaxID=2991066 RepID=UPI003D1DBFC6
MRTSGPYRTNIRCTFRSALQKWNYRTAGAETASHDLREAERIVNSRIFVPLFQYEYDAVVDFIFNHRSGNNEFFALVNTGHYDQAPSKFQQYTAAYGKHPLGLVRRRRAEGRLFATGNYDATH